jgi:hypothetical protein
MLGLVITLVAAATPAQPAPADATCADGPACVAELADPGDAGQYATPAVIDCRWSMGAAALFGECDGTPHDASYRVSRFSDGEQRTVELRPGRRDHRPTVAVCDGLPPHADLTLTPSQPVAMYAAPAAVILDVEPAALPGPVLHLPSRFGDPPDRPPRV